MDGALMEGISTMPIAWKMWVYWMMFINTVSIVFLKNKEARWVLAAWIPNGITMTLMADHFGYVRLLGLSHAIWWTPLLVYLFTRRKSFDLKTVFGKWMVALVVTISLSLVVDYIDVIRYVAGDRDDQRPALETPEQLEPPAVDVEQAINTPRWQVAEEFDETIVA